MKNSNPNYYNQDSYEEIIKQLQWKSSFKHHIYTWIYAINVRTQEPKQFPPTNIEIMPEAPEMRRNNERDDVPGKLVLVSSTRSSFANEFKLIIWENLCKGALIFICFSIIPRSYYFVIAHCIFPHKITMVKQINDLKEFPTWQLSK